MKKFLCDDFLLSNEFSVRLFHEVASELPIYDYHCHLSPKEISENRRYDNIAQIWLEGDHYKWRAMRTAGVDEHFVTGNATDWEKFEAWSTVVPKCIGNPIYHWTHMELKRPFGIEGTLFNPQSSSRIWESTLELLDTPEFSARGILKQMNVVFVGTTDDPCDSLDHHAHIASDQDFDIEVSPSWRPDNVIKINSHSFKEYIAKLEAVSDVAITSYASLLSALEKQLDHFQARGCRSADHGIDIMHFEKVPSDSSLDYILKKKLNDESLSELEVGQYFTAVLVWLGEQYHRRGWVMQLHIGPQRNNNSRMLESIGRDSGFDSMGDKCFAEPLGCLLDAMDQNSQLPQTILYTINPSANEMLATMAGNFQDGSMPGKIQFGSAWWFNDQKDGMERHLEQFSQLSLLSTFVGMLTDSRSFLSFIRHEYFRRILCNKIGTWVSNGEVPWDFELLSQIVRDVCFYNAKNYFKLPGERDSF